ncbi:Ribosomal protein L28/L40 mitochondrial [Trinorchestia longiramus]|nr:Ribosomal protein L28/L40 mitochondrial [Trinorchestia longiramus]
MALSSSYFTSLSRCCLQNGSPGLRCISTQSGPLYVQLTSSLRAEPLKKKKRADPALEKAREEKKIRRIEKAIRKLEKNEGQLKPIEEVQVSMKLKQEMKLRERPAPQLSNEEVLARRDCELRWGRYKFKQVQAESAIIATALEAQRRALQELRQVSESLWSEAIEQDQFALPFRTYGPMSSLPIKDYEAPDGDYVDVTRKWE